MELILHHGIKIMGQRRITVIVDTAFRTCCQMRRSLALKQFAKVILAKCIFALLQALVIQYKAFGHILFENTGRPDAKAGRPAGINTVSHRDNSVQIIKLCRAAHLAAALHLNYRGFLGSCRFIQFSLCIDIF